MPQSMSTSRRLLIAAGILLLVNSQLNTRYAKWLGRVPAGIVKTVTVWPRGLIHHIAVGTLVEDSRTQPEGVDVQDLREDLGLSQALARALGAENDRLRRELVSFRAIGAIIDLDGFTPLLADVTGRSTDPSNPTIGLSAGSRSGVALDQPVVVGGNLIGFVSEADIAQSTVKLITAADSTIYVRIVPIDWNTENPPQPEQLIAKHDRTGPYFYCEVQRSSHSFEPGQIATVYDNLYAQANGFTVGQVVEIVDAPDQPLLLDRIIIRPVLVPGQQREVTVLIPR